MTSKRRDLLTDLFSDDETTENRAAPALPGLDRRVELYLRALHGARPFTDAEKASARERLLDEMARHAMEGDSAAPASVVAAVPMRHLMQRLQAAATALGARLFAGGGSLRLATLSVAALGCVWAGAWFVTALSLEQGFAELPARAHLAGNVDGCSGKSRWGGTPIRIEIRCPGPTLKDVALADGYQLQAAEAVTSAGLFGIGRTGTTIVGPVTVSDGARRVVASADGDVEIDREGKISGTVRLTTGAGELQALVAALGGGADKHAAVAEVAEAGRRDAGDADNNAGATDEPALAVSGPLVDVPLTLSPQGLSIGSVFVGPYGGAAARAPEGRKIP